MQQKKKKNLKRGYFVFESFYTTLLLFPCIVHGYLMSLLWGCNINCQWKRIHWIHEEIFLTCVWIFWQKRKATSEPWFSLWPYKKNDNRSNNETWRKLPIDSSYIRSSDCWFSKGSFHLSALQRGRISPIATMAPLLPSLFPHWWALKVCRPLSPPRAVVHVSEVSADSALSITFALCVTAALHLD